MSRKALVTIVCGLVLISSLLAACSDASTGKSFDPESIAKKYVEALFAGQADEAKAMMLASYEYKDEFVAKTDQAIAVFGKYEAKDVRVSASRAWAGGESGESDKRADLQFEYREKGSSAEHDTGLCYVRVTASGGLWGITDIVLAFPDK
jgi:hypothetical protein